MVDPLFLDDCIQKFRSIGITAAQQIGKELQKVLPKGKLRTTMDVKNENYELTCTIIMYYRKAWTLTEKVLLTIAIASPYVHQETASLTPQGITEGTKVMFGPSQAEEEYYTEEAQSLFESKNYESNIKDKLEKQLKQQLRIPSCKKPMRRGKLIA